MNTSNITTQRMLRVPSDMTQIVNQDTMEVYFKEVNEKPVAMAFAGRRTKPDWYFRFNNRDQLNQKIESWKKNLEAHNKVVAERKTRRVVSDGSTIKIL